MGGRAPPHRTRRPARRNGPCCGPPPSAALARRGGSRNQIDQRGAGAQLDQLGLLEPALDMAVQDPFVELDRAVEIADAQHDVVEPGDADPRLGARSLSRLDIPCVRHCRLLSLAVASLYRELAGAGSRIIAARAGTAAPRRGADAGCARRGSRRGRERRRGWRPSGRSAPPARCPARSWARCMYCSRVMPPAAGAAGAGAAALDSGGLRRRRRSAGSSGQGGSGSSDKPSRAAIRGRAHCYDLRLIINMISYICVACKRPSRGLHRRSCRIGKKAGLAGRFARKSGAAREYSRPDSTLRQPGAGKTTCNTAGSRPIAISTCRGCRPTCSCPRRAAS